MKIYNDIEQLDNDDQNSILIIGNFDGVHLGHQNLLKKGREIAKRENKKLAILSFEPHPRKLFRPDDPPFRITPPDYKAEILKNYDVDILFALEFNWDFASQSAEDFIQNILKYKISPAQILVGYDFAFGQLRKGNAETLRDAGYEVHVMEAYLNEQGQKISSSAVRTALRHGDMDAAHLLLGHRWEIHGVVVKGDQRGRTIGYPTANVHLHDTIHPAYGVYACLVQIQGEQEWHKAATNIGIRPMFELSIGQVEAHILDFNEDIYGLALRIIPFQKLRGEAKFDTLEALIDQIGQDCARSRDILPTNINL